MVLVAVQRRGFNAGRAQSVGTRLISRLRGGLPQAVRPTAILLAGPTASGKSALALALARDARRRRSSMPIPCRSIATCASSRRGRRRRRRRACRTCSTAMSTRPRIIRSAAGASTRRRRSRRRSGKGGLPILVGGTGLYFKALTPRARGGAAGSRRHPRGGARAAQRTEGVAPLYAELVQPRSRHGAERLMPGDRSRITRALEVVLATGRSLTDWHRDGMKPALDPSARGQALSRAWSARSSIGASTRASTRCSPRVRSTKCARSPRAGSIRRCRP